MAGLQTLSLLLARRWGLVWRLILEWVLERLLDPGGHPSASLARRLSLRIECARQSWIDLIQCLHTMKLIQLRSALR